MKKKGFIILLVMITIFVASYSIYLRYHPNIVARIEISAIDDAQYESIGGLSYLKHPEKENFKQLHFYVQINYGNNIEDVEVSFSAIRDLVGDDVYHGGNGWNESHERAMQFSEEIVIYTGEITKEKIVELLNEGQLTVSWKVNGDKKSKNFKMGEIVVFRK